MILPILLEVTTVTGLKTTINLNNISYIQETSNGQVEIGMVSQDTFIVSSKYEDAIKTIKSYIEEVSKL